MDALVSNEAFELIPQSEHVQEFSSEVVQAEAEAFDALKKCTIRERSFVRGLLSGMTQVGAYESAGYRQKNRETMWTKASKLCRKEQVLVALKISERAQMLKFGIPKPKKLDHLWRLAQITGDPESEHFQARASVAALHEASLLDGAHAAKQVNVNANIGFSLNYELQLPGGREPIDSEVVEIPDEVGPGKLSQPSKPR